MSYTRAQAQGDAVPQQLEELARPHVDSFDYFISEGMDRVIEDLEGIEVGVYRARIRIDLNCRNPIPLHPSACRLNIPSPSKSTASGLRTPS
jgi:hypothetical protein